MSSPRRLAGHTLGIALAATAALAACGAARHEAQRRLGRRSLAAGFGRVGRRRLPGGRRAQVRHHHGARGAAARRLGRADRAGHPAPAGRRPGRHHGVVRRAAARGVALGEGAARRRRARGALGRRRLRVREDRRSRAGSHRRHQRRYDREGLQDSSPARSHPPSPASRARRSTSPPGRTSPTRSPARWDARTTARRSSRRSRRRTPTRLPPTPSGRDSPRRSPRVARTTACCTSTRTG